MRYHLPSERVNRTILELKLYEVTAQGRKALRVNRTILELKLCKIKNVRAFNSRVNRTILELKRLCRQSQNSIYL